MCWLSKVRRPYEARVSSVVRVAEVIVPVFETDRPAVRQGHIDAGANVPAAVPLDYPDRDCCWTP